MWRCVKVLRQFMFYRKLLLWLNFVVFNHVPMAWCRLIGDSQGPCKLNGFWVSPLHSLALWYVIMGHYSMGRLDCYTINGVWSMVSMWLMLPALWLADINMHRVIFTCTVHWVSCGTLRARMISGYFHRFSYATASPLVQQYTNPVSELCKVTAKESMGREVCMKAYSN